MIQRVVLVEIKPEYRGDLPQIAQHTREVLAGAAGVRALEVTVAADARTRREWQLCILVRFDDLAATDVYRDDEVHRAYADIYLAPLRKAIRVYHFDLGDS